MSMQDCFCRNLIQSHSQFSVKSQPYLMGKRNYFTRFQFCIHLYEKSKDEGPPLNITGVSRSYEDVEMRLKFI